MSEERVELVRSGFAAWNEEDPSWVLEHMSPEVLWITPDTDPYSGTYRGHAGVQEFWTRWRAAVGKLHFTPREMIDAGDHVVVVAHRRARSEETGLEISDLGDGLMNADFDKGAAKKFVLNPNDLIAA